MQLKKVEQKRGNFFFLNNGVVHGMKARNVCVCVTLKQGGCQCGHLGG